MRVYMSYYLLECKAHFSKIYYLVIVSICGLVSGSTLTQFEQNWYRDTLTW